MVEKSLAKKTTVFSSIILKTEDAFSVTFLPLFLILSLHS